MLNSEYDLVSSSSLAHPSSDESLHKHYLTCKSWFLFRFASSSSWLICNCLHFTKVKQATLVRSTIAGFNFGVLWSAIAWSLKYTSIQAICIYTRKQPDEVKLVKRIGRSNFKIAISFSTVSLWMNYITFHSNATVIKHTWTRSLPNTHVLSYPMEHKCAKLVRS